MMNLWIRLIREESDPELARFGLLLVLLALAAVTVSTVLNW
ncbi:MAG: hypothetical protein AB1556_09555 [Bacillota bacterium]